MNGNRYLLDTNTIIQLLLGNEHLLRIVNGADYVATSVICEIEFLCFPNLPEEDRKLFDQFKGKTEIFDVFR